MRGKLSLFVVAAALGAAILPMTASAQSTGERAMYRLYNPYTGEHFYTGQVRELDSLRNLGWVDEGEGWVAPVSSDTPVYRLYNPYVPGGDHHYTMDEGEYKALQELGWIGEGIGWYSDDAQTIKVLRQYNPNAVTGTHNYTADTNEARVLVDSNGWKDESIAWYGVAVSSGMTPIMGSSQVSVAQMVAYFKSTGHSYPELYANFGASSIEEYCSILFDEANTEGVRAEVVFCQAMTETGWLQFGGQVKAEQCNFAGIGAVNQGAAAGASFASVREGLRAQIQHLKAYASTDSLVNECVDPRFNLVRRGIATTLQRLDGRWAVPGYRYGENISAMIDLLLEF